MKLSILFKVLLVVAVVLGLGVWLSSPPGAVEAQEPSGDGLDAQAVVVNTAFTYQGFLKNGTIPADGPYDFQFKLFDAASGGLQVGSTLSPQDQTVTDGYFAVELNFGDVFKGDARWLEIAMREGASTGPYTTLTPRVRLTFTPYSLGLRPGATISNPGTPGLVVQSRSTVSGTTALLAEITPTTVVSFSAAVRGINNNISGFGYGVYGEHKGGGNGVRGVSTSGQGVFGKSVSSAGVSGNSTSSVGVIGGSNSGIGVEGGSNTNTGVAGVSTSGRGVSGLSSSNFGVEGGSNTNTGVAGVSTSGRGVTGTSSSGVGIEGTSFSNTGVSGVSTSGLGVSGNSGSNIALNGTSNGNSLPTLKLRNNNTGPLIEATSASGEFKVDNQGSASFGSTPRQMLNLWGTAHGIGVQNFTTYFRSGFGFAWFRGGSHSNTQDDPGAGGTRLMRLDLNGNLFAAGGIFPNGADLSERFEVRSDQPDLEPIPGFVVSIDPEHPGELVISDRAYDRTVIGIISGAGDLTPGVVLSQEGVAEGQYPIALSGRVYVWADATSGPIQPGDLLTTSATPGHVMKVTDYDQAQGAILGKAMSTLDEGQGLVLVFVSLQ